MSEKNFQAVVKYGAMALGLALLLNIWSVMRYREVYRDAVKAEGQVQQTMAMEPIFQAILQDFNARANSDPHIAEILRQAGVVPNTAAGQRIQH